MAGLRVAIVGAGLMGGWHARYAASIGAEVGAIVDANVEASAALQAAFPGARTFRELRECLGSYPADVVHVCTGLDSHVRLSEAALRAGKHVLVEKPAAPSSLEAGRLVELARHAKLKLNPVHQLPFQRGFLRVSRDLGRLGELVRVTYATCSAGGDGHPPSRRRAILLEILPHPLSLFRAVLGDGVDPAAWNIVNFTDDDLEMAAQRAGTRLGIFISLRARPPRNELILTGTRATARLDLFHGYGVVESGGTTRASKILAPFREGSALLAAAGANLLRRTLEWEPAYPGLRELIRRFYGAVRDDASPPISFEELTETVAVIERVQSRAEPPG